MGQILDVEPIGDVVTSGITNISQITWTQRGNVINVKVLNWSKSSTSATEITGLPIPVNEEFVSIHLFMGVNHTGVVQYYNHKWTIEVFAANNYAYGQGCYLTDD